MTPVYTALDDAPKEITLEGSNDGSISAFNSGTWELILRAGNIPPPPSQFVSQVLFFSNTKAFRHYRWTVIHTQGPSTCCLQVAEVQLLGVTNVGTGSAPFIFTQPNSQTVANGSTAVFAAGASGASPLFYQWSKDGTNLSIGSTNSLVLSNVQPGQAGSYRVAVTNSYGAASSADAFLTVVAQSSSRPVDGLLGWWPGEGNVQDVLGLNDGVLVNGVTFAPGMVGQAFGFEQPDDYVEIPDTPALNPGGLTLEGWIFPEAPAAAESMIACKGATFQLQLLVNDPAQTNLVLYAQIRFPTNTIALPGAIPVPLGQWTHVAVTFDRSGFKLYENGVLDVTGRGDYFLQSWHWHEPQPWRFGGGIRASFQGRLDEFSLYDHALSVAEIQHLYDLGKAGLMVPPQILSEPSSLSVGIGMDASFRVVAKSPGATPLSYQWQWNGAKIQGESGSTLQFHNLQPGQSGRYQVLVSSAFGTVSSSPASLAVAGTVAWGGWNRYGETNIPAGLVDVTAIAGGGAHCLALKSDGTVVGWGDDSYGQATPPIGQNQFVAISAGGSHSLGLTPDGTVVAWGDNSYGQATPPIGQSDFIAVSAGGSHSLALKSDGTVVAWGVNDWGQTNPPPNLMGVVAIAAGVVHNLALKSDGSVVAWGGDWDGITEVPAGLTNVVAVSAGFFQSLALRSDGSLISWGRFHAPSVTNAVAIAAGDSLSLALLSDGSVIAWGDQYMGPISPPAGLPNVVAIAAGWFHGLALLRDGSPKMTIEPWDQLVPAGGNSSFSAKAVGEQSMAYQWRFNGNSIPGATSDSLTVSNAQAETAGLYSLTAYNQRGATVSRQAQLTVLPLPTDTDGDGMPDEWELAHGLNPNDPGDALVGPALDPFSNLMRYALGIETTSPPTSKSPITAAVQVGNNSNHFVAFMYKQRKLTPGLQYIPEVSGDNHTWHSDAAHVQLLSRTSLDAQFDLITVQDTTAVTPSTPRAFRLRVVR